MTAPTNDSAEQHDAVWHAEEHAVWTATFDAYQRAAYTLEGAMAHADDAVRRWRAGEPA